MHVCTSQCRFTIPPRGRPFCVHSGVEHHCKPGVCLTNDQRDGDCTCMWTGIVHCVHNTRIDNTLVGNLSRDAFQEEGTSSYARKSLGYAIKSSRPAIKYGSHRQRGCTHKKSRAQSFVEPVLLRPKRPLNVNAGSVDTGKKRRTSNNSPPVSPVLHPTVAAPKQNAQQEKIQQVCYSSQVHDSTPSPLTLQIDKDRRASFRKREETRKNGLARPSVFAPSRIRPVLASHVPNTPSSRNAAIAKEMAWCLFMYSKVRVALRLHANEKRVRIWRQMIRKRIVSNGCYNSCVELYEDWIRAYNQIVAAADVAGGTHDVKHAARDCENGQSMPRVEYRTTLHDRLCGLIAQFLLEGWSKMTATKLWRKEPPDFASFVMGVCYTAREGGIVIDGCEIIPELAFFKTHAPDVNQLTVLCETLNLKDCRTSAYGRARIMEGMNAIRATLWHEQNNGGIPITDLAFDVPEELTRHFCHPEANSPWCAVAPPRSNSADV